VQSVWVQAKPRLSSGGVATAVCLGETEMKGDHRGEPGVANRPQPSVY